MRFIQESPQAKEAIFPRHTLCIIAAFWDAGKGSQRHGAYRIIEQAGASAPARGCLKMIYENHEGQPCVLHKDSTGFRLKSYHKPLPYP